MFRLDEFEVAGEVIDDLRDEPPPVNRVCGAELDSQLIEFFTDCLIAEDFLNAVLRVVEISSDRRDVDIGAGLRDHLQSLNLAYAAVGIKDHDFSLRHVRETRQSRLARVTGGRHED